MLEVYPVTSVPMRIEIDNRLEIMIMNEIRVALSIYLLCAAMLASTPALAASSIATLRQVQGNVLVEHVAGYRRAFNGAELQIGERLMVLEGASAVVVGRGGCVVRLAENAHFVVGKGDDCSAVVHPAAATLLAQAIGFDPSGPKSDVGSGGFGAIGAEPRNKLTPMDIKRAEEAPDLPDAKNAKSATGGGKVPGAAPSAGEASTTVVAARKPIRANAPNKDNGESFFAGGGGAAAVAGAIAGGVGLIVALAGGGGGAGGTDTPPPITAKPSQNNGGGAGTGNSGGGSGGGGQPPVLSPQ